MVSIYTATTEKMTLQLPSSLFYLISLFTINVCVAASEATSTVSLPPIPPISEELNKDLLWGTYRPNIYFGTRTRTARSLSTGMLWGAQASNPWEIKLRHSCEQDASLHYEWKAHNGRSFGIQHILDKTTAVNISVSFLKYLDDKEFGGEWTAKITSNAYLKRRQSALVWFYYMYVEAGTLKLQTKRSKKGISNDVVVTGSSEDLGDFTIAVIPSSANVHIQSENKHGLPDLNLVHFTGIASAADQAWRVEDFIQRQLHATTANKIIPLLQKLHQQKKQITPEMTIPTLNNVVEKNANVFIFQFIVPQDFEFDVVYLSHALHGKQSTQSRQSKFTPKELASLIKPKTGDNFYERLWIEHAAFVNRFDSQFSITSSKELDWMGGIKISLKDFGQRVLSNVLGGIGFFHGRGAMILPDRKAAFMEPRDLYTATPCRPFFPRGFLWDEGFHQIVVYPWDYEISLDVVRHWFNLMESNGWIPREQILGDEARSRVPDEFQLQDPSIANPPTFFFLIQQMLNDLGHQKKHNSNSEHDEREGFGEIDPSFQDTKRHHVRVFLVNLYPRVKQYYDWLLASQRGVAPNSFRWRGRHGNHTLSSGLDDYPRVYPPSVKELHLDLHCWMAYAARVMEAYASFTNDRTRSQEYGKLYDDLLTSLNEYHWNDEQQIYLDVAGWTEGKIQHVNHIGYISLFPMLLGLLPSESPRLSLLLSALKNVDTLWSPHGVRSLSKSDPLFGTFEDYWRGPIWMNINYLIIARLHEYSRQAGPLQKEFEESYKQLRENVLRTIVANYEQTGYLWEQYNAETGKGQKNHPFSGWTALVLNILSQTYIA